MGHVGNMGHVDFTYFCDNKILNYSDNKGDDIKMIRNIFILQVTLKILRYGDFS